MRICSSQPSVHYDDSACLVSADGREWRWSLVLEFHRRQMSTWLSFDQEMRSKPGDKWEPARQYMGIGFSPFDWCLGFHMFYYEGEWWRFSLGPFHVNWH